MPFFSAPKNARFRLVTAIAVFLLAVSAGLPTSAADLEDEIDQIEQQRADNQQRQEEQGAQIEQATAQSEQLAQALAAINRQVATTEASLEKAQAELDSAKATLSAANDEVLLAEAKAADLEDKVADRAIQAFVGRDTSAAGPVSAGADRAPQEATRMRTMVGEATDQDFDVAEELRATRADLAFKRAEAAAAKDKADAAEKQIADELSALEADRDEQAELAAAAEEQLDRELYEQQILEEQDAELAKLQKQKYTELQQQLAAAQAREDAKRKAAAAAAASSSSSSSSSSGPRATYPSSSQIVKVGGFWIHVDVADNLERLLAQARADGINLGGWAYRDHQAQIRLRRAHCGTSQYAIWQMPSSQCRPPTARPGSSMHEQGKAIDFTYNGGSIGSRSNRGYRWLAANANRYGFYNLPSEPWHWSTNGN